MKAIKTIKTTQTTNTTQTNMQGLLTIYDYLLYLLTIYNFLYMDAEQRFEYKQLLDPKMHERLCTAYGKLATIVSEVGWTHCNLMFW